MRLPLFICAYVLLVFLCIKLCLRSSCVTDVALNGRTPKEFTFVIMCFYCGVRWLFLGRVGCVSLCL